MTLNISPKKTKPAAARTSRSLLGEVVDVLTAWNPREFIVAFQRWNRGQVSPVLSEALAGVA